MFFVCDLFLKAVAATNRMEPESKERRRSLILNELDNMANHHSGNNRLLGTIDIWRQRIVAA